jgi:hypothetical protein
MKTNVKSHEKCQNYQEIRLIFIYLKIGTCYKKKCKKCLETENIPLTDLLFYILEVLDLYRYKSSHLAM